MHRLLFAAVLTLATGCASGPSAEAVQVQALNEAQAIKDERGFVAAIPAYEVAAHAGDGLSAVFLWDHYDRQGDAAVADTFKTIATTSIDEAIAWRIWAFRGHDLGSERANILAAAERLRTGVRQGSQGAASELARLVARLEAEAATDNAAAQGVLDHLPEASS